MFESQSSRHVGYRDDTMMDERKEALTPSWDTSAFRYPSRSVAATLSAKTLEHTR